MRRAFGGLFFLSVAVLASAAESTITAGELRCDFRANPLGIEDAQPRLSWVVSGAGRGVVQTACQVMVASGPGCSTRKANLWDSGRVSRRSAHATPLRSATACWRVRVWCSRPVLAVSEIATGQWASSNHRTGRPGGSRAVHEPEAHNGSAPEEPLAAARALSL